LLLCLKTLRDFAAHQLHLLGQLEGVQRLSGRLVRGDVHAIARTSQSHA
jgi:hypothetical protein